MDTTQYQWRQGTPYEITGIAPAGCSMQHTPCLSSNHRSLLPLDSFHNFGVRLYGVHCNLHYSELLYNTCTRLRRFVVKHEIRHQILYDNPEFFSYYLWYCNQNSTRLCIEVCFRFQRPEVYTRCSKLDDRE